MTAFTKVTWLLYLMSYKKQGKEGMMPVFFAIFVR